MVPSNKTHNLKKKRKRIEQIPNILHKYFLHSHQIITDHLQISCSLYNTSKRISQKQWNDAYQQGLYFLFSKKDLRLYTTHLHDDAVLHLLPWFATCFFFSCPIGRKSLKNTLKYFAVLASKVHNCISVSNGFWFIKPIPIDTPINIMPIKTFLCLYLFCIKRKLDF